MKTKGQKTKRERKKKIGLREQRRDTKQYLGNDPEFEKKLFLLALLSFYALCVKASCI